MEQIAFDDFLKVQLRVGRIMQADAFPQARKPAYVLHVDFGPELAVNAQRWGQPVGIVTFNQRDYLPQARHFGLTLASPRQIIKGD